MRTLIDLPDNQIEALAELCEQIRQPRAAIIRQAISEYLARRMAKPTEAAYGLWGAEAMDGLAYQEKVRTEW